MTLKTLQEAPIQIKRMNRKMLHILLVEDDEVDVMNVKRAFAKHAINNPLYVASNGLEALAMLRGEEGVPPSVPAGRRLILLDLNMPRMGGIEFLQVLRADPHLALTPVVVLTTSNEDRDRVEAYKLSVAGYLVKPVTFSEFSEMMGALNWYWTLSEMPVD
jgi:CheY-like chemotaxis protein